MTLVINKYKPQQALVSAKNDLQFATGMQYL
jgi:hypothetical protein